jgi:hypothetical protein
MHHEHQQSHQCKQAMQSNCCLQHEEYCHEALTHSGNLPPLRLLLLQLPVQLAGTCCNEPAPLAGCALILPNEAV